MAGSSSPTFRRCKVLGRFHNRCLFLLLPTTYISEGLRAAYAPGSPHMPLSSIAAGMGAAAVLLFLLADFAFRRRLGHFAW